MGSLLAVLSRSLAVAGSQRAMLGRSSSIVRSPHPLIGGTRGDVGALHRMPTVLPDARTVALRHREIASVSSLVTQQCRNVSSLGASIAAARVLQPRRRGLLTRTTSTLTNVAAEAVRSAIDATRKIAIAGGLVTVSRDLIAICAQRSLSAAV
jgi:hypothetical protein